MIVEDYITSGGDSQYPSDLLSDNIWLLDKSSIGAAHLRSKTLLKWSLPALIKVPTIEVQEIQEDDLSPIGEPPHLQTLRILMLHGFTQSGDEFRVKTARLKKSLLESISPDEYPGGIEFLYPSGPVHLRLSDLPGVVCAPEDDGDHHGWWRNLSFIDPYAELDTTMAWLVDYVRDVGPIDGVIGFSQGAAMSMMLTSLCEGFKSPERLRALANQKRPIRELPPQLPLKFAVAFSGYRGIMEYYDGFYNPKITTPTMLIVGDWDTMVSEERSMELLDACTDTQVVRHRGVHHVPTDQKSTSAVVEFIKQYI